LMMKKSLNWMMGALLVMSATQTMAADLSEGLVAYYPLSADATDSSGNGMNGTVMSGVDFSEGYAQFDGTTNAYIDLPDGFDDFSDGFSFSGWVRYDSLDETYSRIFDFSEGGDANNNIVLCHFGTSSNLYYRLYSGTTPSVGVTEENVFEPEAWQYISLVHSADENVSIYLNGSLVVSTNECSLPDVVERVDNFLGKSNWDNSDGNFNGAMKELRFYDRALSTNEIATLYTATLPSVEITTTNQTVVADTETIDLAGTNNQWIVGTILWTNSANAQSGSVLVSGSTFQVSAIPLAIGANPITVSGTNTLGVTASDAVTITRSSESGADNPTHYVSTTGSHSWPYTSWDTAATNIQAAVDTAVDGDTVWIAAGTYYSDTEITVGKAITIQSMDGPSETFIDGQGEHRCFNLGASACTLSGLSLTNGVTSGVGGGVYCSSTTPVITNCTLSGNSSGGFGAGSYGGTLTDCTLSGNVAVNSGGGASRSTLTRCTLSGNSTEYQGGGAYEGTLTDCILSGNSAYYTGGGASRSTLTGCTLSGNSVLGGTGGGSYGGTLKNCIVWGNTSSAIGEQDIYGSTVSYCCASGGVTHGVNGCITNDPCFTDAANGDYTLLVSSPCINAGNNSYVTTDSDLAGNARIYYSFVDMGAFEYAGVLSGTPDFDGDGLLDSWEALYADSASTLDSDASSDSDAFSNEEEYIAGTDPTDATSYFCVTNCCSEADGFLVEWVSVSGRVYSVSYASSLTNAFQTLESDIAYPQSSYTDTHVMTQGFYRVEVELED
jgi:uncharacterized protein YjbI with pentapeptide repeats